MQAVILAGGLGTRLYPLTKTLPKALVTVQGRTLTDHVLDLLKEAGVEEVFLAVGVMREKIKAYYGDGKDAGIRIRYLDEEEPLGTGGWMHQAKDQLKGDFFVLNGDNLFDVDLKAMLAFHKERKALATIALTKVEDPSSFGIVEMEGERIVDFVEKPSPEDAPSDLASGGYYIFNEDIFEYRLQEQKFMLEHDLFPIIASKRRLFGFPSAAQWFDTGTFERLETVNAQWRKI